MPIGVSHGGINLYASNERTDEVLVGTHDGIVTLKRSGSTWTVASRVLQGQHISAIAPEPVSGTIVAGAFFGRLHASSDGGHTWETRDEGIPYHDFYSLATKKMPDGHIRVYTGTEPANLYYSDDLGRHWTHLPNLRSVKSVKDWWFPSPPHDAHTKFIKLSPDEPEVIYVCIEQGALLRSEDLGENWEELNTLGFYVDSSRPPELFYDIHKLLIDPRDFNKLMLTGGAGFYVSSDRGAHWERRMLPGWAMDVYPDGLVHNPRHPDVMFMSAAGHNPARWREGDKPTSTTNMYRSRDGGTTWDRLEGGLPFPGNEEVGGLTLEDFGGGYQVFAATSAGDVWWSEDGGEKWSCIASGIEAIAKKNHAELLSGKPRARAGAPA